jgi:hypothetical protein
VIEAARDVPRIAACEHWPNGIVAAAGGESYAPRGKDHAKRLARRTNLFGATKRCDNRRGGWWRLRMTGLTSAPGQMATFTDPSIVGGGGLNL